MLRIVEHPSQSYVPRTAVNAKSADLTAAFAVDFSTRGERLTRKLAGDDRYVALSLRDQAIDNARKLYSAVRKTACKTLNIAGNGIYTLVPAGISQADCTLHVYDVIRKVHEHLPLERIISGGQTGIDLAGGIAGAALGLDVVMTLPAGFVQRGVHGKDMRHLESEIRDQVMEGLASLRQNRYF
ncbi:YpsA SLOG family protein [Burkholderia gladioli]|uniref:YpsA SLOG family protein n=1 Tax=Burkholderia gladioli TaxID=28095 RepID=UPI00163E42FE|nr:putative molybdenum carrier protein [Burkholderia gladioli]